MHVAETQDSKMGNCCRRTLGSVLVSVAGVQLDGSIPGLFACGHVSSDRLDSSRPLGLQGPMSARTLEARLLRVQRASSCSSSKLRLRWGLTAEEEPGAGGGCARLGEPSSRDSHMLIYDIAPVTFPAKSGVSHRLPRIDAIRQTRFSACHAGSCPRHAVTLSRATPPITSSSSLSI